MKKLTNKQIKWLKALQEWDKQAPIGPSYTNANDDDLIVTVLKKGCTTKEQRKKLNEIRDYYLMHVGATAYHSVIEKYIK